MLIWANWSKWWMEWTVRFQGTQLLIRFWTCVSINHKLVMTICDCCGPYGNLAWVLHFSISFVHYFKWSFLRGGKKWSGKLRFNFLNRLIVRRVVSWSDVFRCVTGIDFCEQHPELVAVSYDHNPESPLDPMGVVQVWNCRFKKPTAEWVVCPWIF